MMRINSIDKLNLTYNSRNHSSLRQYNRINTDINSRISDVSEPFSEVLNRHLNLDCKKSAMRRMSVCGSSHW